MIDVQKDYEVMATSQDELTDALVAHAQAKYELETHKAKDIVAGIEGKNQAVRDATLRVQLHDHFAQEHAMNIAVIEAKGKYANASRRFEISMMEFNKTPRNTI